MYMYMYVAAQQRKVGKYLDLWEEARNNGYCTELFTVEVGSQEFINMESFYDLHSYI